MKKYTNITAKILLALPLVTFGLNKFLLTDYTKRT